MANSTNLHSISGTESDNLVILTGAWKVVDIATSAPANITAAEFLRTSGSGFESKGALVAGSYAGGNVAEFQFEVTEAWQRLLWVQMNIVYKPTAAANVPFYTELDPSVNTETALLSPLGSVSIFVPNFNGDAGFTWSTGTQTPPIYVMAELAVQNF